jgi:putative transposase
MTRVEVKSAGASAKELLLQNPDGLREVVRAVMQELLEAEMTEALGAEKGERTAERLGYRSGSYGRTLITRVGKLELRVPQDRAGRFSTELFERYQRSERALVATLAEMYVQGVSTRKVKAITEELCGHAFSASSISAIQGPHRSSTSMGTPPSVWMRASPPLPAARFKSPSLTSSSTPVMRRCARPAWS